MLKCLLPVFPSKEAAVKKEKDIAHDYATGTGVLTSKHKSKMGTSNACWILIALLVAPHVADASSALFQRATLRNKAIQRDTELGNVEGHLQQVLALARDGKDMQKLQETVTQMATDVACAETEMPCNSTRPVIQDMFAEMQHLMDAIAGVDGLHAGAVASLNTARQRIVNCSTEHIVDFESYASSAEQKEVSHDACRSSEQGLKLDNDDKHNALVAEFTKLPPTCMCSGPERTAATLYELPNVSTCGATIIQFWVSYNDTVSAANASSAEATSAYEDKIAQCQLAQSKYEDDLCRYQKHLTSSCAAYSICYNKAVAAEVAEHSTIRTTEASLKAEHASADRIQCLLSVLNGSNESSTNQTAALEECLERHANTSHLDIVYKGTPEPADCDTTPVEDKPGCEWLVEQYETKPWWFADVSMADCTECPLAPAPTTAPTSMDDVLTPAPTLDETLNGKTPKPTNTPVPTPPPTRRFVYGIWNKNDCDGVGSGEKIATADECKEAAISFYPPERSNLTYIEDNETMPGGCFSPKDTFNGPTPMTAVWNNAIGKALPNLHPSAGHLPSETEKAIPICKN